MIYFFGKNFQKWTIKIKGQYLDFKRANGPKSINWLN